MPSMNGRIHRLEKIIAVICQLLIDDARAKDTSWHEIYRMLRDFQDQIAKERT